MASSGEQELIKFPDCEEDGSRRGLRMVRSLIQSAMCGPMYCYTSVSKNHPLFSNSTKINCLNAAVRHKHTAQVVPARSSQYISVIFDVRSLIVPPDGVDCQSIGLGYMTLPDASGRIYRQHQYDVPPLRVTMTGQVLRPSLSVEYHDDEAMSYTVTASDLLDDSNQVSQGARLNDSKSDIFLNDGCSEVLNPLSPTVVIWVQLHV